MVKTLRDYVEEENLQKTIDENLKFYDKKFRRAIYIIKSVDKINNPAVITISFPYLKGPTEIIKEVSLKNHYSDPCYGALKRTKLT